MPKPTVKTTTQSDSDIPPAHSPAPEITPIKAVMNVLGCGVLEGMGIINRLGADADKLPKLYVGSRMEEFHAMIAEKNPENESKE